MTSTVPSLIRDADEQRRQFTHDGVLGPERIFTPEACEQLAKAIDAERVAPLDWPKGLAANSRIFYELATYALILERVTQLVGDDVILWASHIVDQQPGRAHPWHNDIESTAPANGKTVTVWLGIQNISVDSSLMVLKRSHRFGTSIQQVRHRHGKNRENTSDDEVLQWAREIDPASEVLRPAMSAGQAVFFDGRCWHGTLNRTREVRRAVLLQYATTDTRVRIPDRNAIDWPWRQLELPRPPCIVVSGDDACGLNRVVRAPIGVENRSTPELTSRIQPLCLPLEPDATAGWQPYPIFSGTTPDLERISCHVSVLAPGATPHPPHTHEQEELLLALSGEVDLLLTDTATPRRRLRAGQFVYYPVGFHHSLETVGEEPAHYLMFKWCTRSAPTPGRLGFGQFELLGDESKPFDSNGFSAEHVFAGPTDFLRSLRCHRSTLAPGGGGYAPHIDAYDVALVILGGEVETLGHRVAAPGVVFYAAGEPHGISNSSDVPARYIVFAFHAGRGGPRVLDAGQSQRRASS